MPVMRFTVPRSFNSALVIVAPVTVRRELSERTSGQYYYVGHDWTSRYAESGETSYESGRTDRQKEGRHPNISQQETHLTAILLPGRSFQPREEGDQSNDTLLWYLREKKASQCKARQ